MKTGWKHEVCPGGGPWPPSYERRRLECPSCHKFQYVTLNGRMLEHSVRVTPEDLRHAARCQAKAAGSLESTLGALALWLAGLPARTDDPEVEHLRCDELMCNVLEALDPAIAKQVRERQDHYWYA